MTPRRARSSGPTSLSDTTRLRAALPATLAAVVALAATPASAQPPDPTGGPPPELAEQAPGAAEDAMGPDPGAPAGEPAEASPALAETGVASGPEIELAPQEPQVEAPAAPAAPANADRLRGLRTQRLEAARGGTTLGGYGELHYGLRVPDGGGESEAEIDLHRLVLFIAHQFHEAFRFYGELEVEHAFSGDGLPGEVAVEQAYVDWLLGGDALGLRAGIVLVPMGIVNQWHEPPIFQGVERPMVDRVVIPTTWREGGVGVFGEPVEGLRYEAYVVGGLDPTRFSTSSGIRSGRQSVAEARADALALSARVEVEPVLGLVAGLSGYFSLAGPNAGELQQVVGVDMATGAPILASIDASVPLVGVAVDARVRHAGLEARAVGAMWSIGDAEALALAADGDGTSLGIDAPDQVVGAYGEVGYDVLSLTDCDQELVPFARLEWYDTTFGHRDGATQGSRATLDLAFGLSYRPVEAVVLKGDVTRRDRAEGEDETVVALGVGWMF